MGTYFAITLDPLHVGAGGYRLGRVDKTIVRERATRLPKIPGTSLAGSCRSHAYAALTGEEHRTAAKACAALEGSKRGNCGKSDCPICQVFGHAAGDSDGCSMEGRVNFYDAKIVAFPVATIAGPVWVTTPELLKEAGGTGGSFRQNDTNILITNFDPPGGGQAKLNLGWLYMDVKKQEFKLPEGEWASLLSRLVVAPEWLFPELVNSNLEVRTSVSIDVRTGAAADKLLFTYEAIPAGALLRFDVEIQKDRCTETWTEEEVGAVVSSGFERMAILGLGGMNTRGFGRLRVYMQGAGHAEP